MGYIIKVIYFLFAVSFSFYTQGSEGEKKYTLALMNSEEYEILSGITNREERIKFISHLKPQLGEDYLDSYEGVTLYYTTNNFDFTPVTDLDFFNFYKNDAFKEALKEITDMKHLDRCLASFTMDETQNISLYMLVFCKLLEGGLDPFENLQNLTSLGGNRGCDTNSDIHVPVYSTIEIDYEDPACIGKDERENEVGKKVCVLDYDVALLQSSYRDLIDNKKYLEVYLKSKEYKNESYLTERYCFLNELANDLHSPHIKRLFVEETGKLSGRLNPREGDFRKKLIWNLKNFENKSSCVDELIVKLSGDNPDSIDVYKKEVDHYYADKINSLQKHRERVLESFKELEKLEKKFTSKENIRHHIKCMKIIDTAYGMNDFWEKMYDKTTNIELKKEMDSCGGRKLSSFYDKSAYSDVIRYNDLSKRLKDSATMYFDTKEDLLATLKKKQELFDDISNDEIIKIFADEGLLMNYLDTDDTSSRGIKKSYLRDISRNKDNSFYDLAGAINGYNEVDKLLLEKLRSDREGNVSKILKEFEKLHWENISTDIRNNEKGFGLTIKINPIKIPTPADIGRELGGILTSAGDVIDESGRLVINIADEVTRKGEELFDNTGRELTNLKKYVDEGATNIARYFRKDFEDDIFNALRVLIIKPINWLACGGKQPPDNEKDRSKDDGCIEGGIDCTIPIPAGDNSKSKDEAECRLTDSQGNPSDVPDTSEDMITDEQLQWMRDMEMQDMLNSMDFSNQMKSWMSDPNQAISIQKMLTSKQAELSEKVKNQENLTAEEKSELAKEIQDQKDIIDLITAGAGAAAENVIQTFKDLINIAQTKKELEATINFVAENGLDGLADAMGDNLGVYWDEFQGDDEIGKAKTIGRVASDVVLTIVPVSALVKFGKTSIKGVAAASKLNGATNLLSKVSLKLGLNTSDKISDLAKWAGGDLSKLVNNQNGQLGPLLKSYKPAPRNPPKGFTRLRKAKEKTRSRGGGLRKRWKDSKGNIYEWDYQHGKVEKYNKRGKHLGEFDPNTGKQTKPPNPDYRVEP